MDLHQLPYKVHKLCVKLIKNNMKWASITNDNWTVTNKRHGQLLVTLPGMALYKSTLLLINTALYSILYS